MRSLRDRFSTFVYRGDSWWVGRSCEVSGDERGRIVSSTEAARLVGRWCDDPAIWPRMLAVYEKQCGPLHQAPNTRQALREIEPALRDALEHGHLVVLREPREPIALPPPPKRPSLPSVKRRPPARVKHYVDVTVQYENGAALEGRRYRLQLPDARIQEGIVDASGRVFNPDVPEGTAWFWILPDKGASIDAEEIAPPEGADS